MSLARRTFLFGPWLEINGAALRYNVGVVSRLPCQRHGLILALCHSHR